MEQFVILPIKNNIIVTEDMVKYMCSLNNIKYLEKHPEGFLVECEASEALRLKTEYNTYLNNFATTKEMENRLLENYDDILKEFNSFKNRLLNRDIPRTIINAFVDKLRYFQKD